MLLMELLSEELIQMSLEATSKAEAIEELVDLLIREHELRMRDRALVLSAIYAQEKELSSGLEGGVAVPHGAVDGIDEMVAAMGVSRQGIEFDTTDGKPAHLILLMAIPRNAFKSHVRTLAGVARLLHHETMVHSICTAREPAEVMRIIHDEESAEFRSGESNE